MNMYRHLMSGTMKVNEKISSFGRLKKKKRLKNNEGMHLQDHAQQLASMPKLNLFDDPCDFDGLVVFNINNLITL